MVSSVVLLRRVGAAPPTCCCRIDCAPIAEAAETAGAVCWRCAVTACRRLSSGDDATGTVGAAYRVGWWWQCTGGWLK